MEAGQKPIELILARNLISSLSTPAFLVDEGGVLIFYNCLLYTSPSPRD